MSSNRNEIVAVTPKAPSVTERNKSNLQTVCTTIVLVQPVLSSIAREIVASRERIKTLHEQILLVEKQNDYSIERMKLAFDNIRPTIDSTNEQINELLSQMKTFNLNDMSESQYKTYNGLMLMVMQMREQLYSLYEKVLE